MLKNITFSAEPCIIEKARKFAAGQNMTLNLLFREWLRKLVAMPSSGKSYKELMSSLKHISIQGKISRDELNER